MPIILNAFFASSILIHHFDQNIFRFLVIIYTNNYNIHMLNPIFEVIISIKDINQRYQSMYFKVTEIPALIFLYFVRNKIPFNYQI